MQRPLAEKAGTALCWKVAQLAGVKLIYLLRLVILARLLTPEDFGLLAVAMVAIDLLLSVTDFGMIHALVQRTNASDSHYHAAWTFVVIRGLIITGVLVLAAPIVARILAEPQATNIIRALALRPFIEAVASIKVAALTRELQFRSIAFVRLSEVVCNTVIAIALARLLGVWALVAGSLAGLFAYVVMSYIMAPFYPRLNFDLVTFRSLIHYGRWLFLTSLLVVSGSVTLRTIISRELGAAELGLYFLSVKLAFLPSEITSGVIGSVAFPLYAGLQAKVQQVASVFRSLFIGTLVTLVPVFFLMIVLAPTLVTNVLGPRWEGTVLVIQLLAVAGILGLVGDASVPVFNGLGQPYKFAILEGMQSLLLILFALCFTARFGLLGAALAWLAAAAGALVVSSVFLTRMLPQAFTGLGIPLLAIIVASGSGAGVALGINTLVSGLVGFVVANLVAVCIIVSLLWIADRRYDLGLIRDVARAFPQIAKFLGLTPTDRFPSASFPST